MPLLFAGGSWSCLSPGFSSTISPPPFWFHGEVTFSGDEPYYLLTTHSLYQDQDINVWNNYARKDYFSFYEKEHHPNLELGMYAREGQGGDKDLYPINLSGISFLMLPHYWLAQQFSGPLRTIILKGSLSLWAVLLSLQLYLFCLERWGRNRISLRLWALYSFTAPVLFYAVHLYPEIPIAFFSLYIYRKVRLGKNLSSAAILFIGGILGLFLWFGLKYNMIFFPLLLIGLYSLWKEQRAGWKSLLFLAGPGLSLVLFYLYVYMLYGSFYPFSIYEGVMTPEKITAFKEMLVNIPVLLRIDTFFDYFLDQRDGLLLYAPFYLFGFLGMVEAFRKARKEFWILLFISAPFILNYAFFSHRQGHCPQGRIIAPLSWVAAVFIGYFLVYNSKKIYRRLFVWFSAASIAVVLVLFLNPSFLYQPTTHDHLVPTRRSFYFDKQHPIFSPRLPPLVHQNQQSWAYPQLHLDRVYHVVRRDLHLQKKRRSAQNRHEKMGRPDLSCFCPFSAGRLS